MVDMLQPGEAKWSRLLIGNRIVASDFDTQSLSLHAGGAVVLGEAGGVQHYRIDPSAGLGSNDPEDGVGTVYRMLDVFGNPIASAQVYLVSMKMQITTAPAAGSDVSLVCGILDGAAAATDSMSWGGIDTDDATNPRARGGLNATTSTATADATLTGVHVNWGCFLDSAGATRLRSLFSVGLAGSVGIGDARSIAASSLVTLTDNPHWFVSCGASTAIATDEEVKATIDVLAIPRPIGGFA
jgi:hypothetical protein